MVSPILAEQRGHMRCMRIGEGKKEEGEASISSIFFWLRRDKEKSRRQPDGEEGEENALVFFSPAEETTRRLLREVGISLFFPFLEKDKFARGRGKKKEDRIVSDQHRFGKKVEKKKRTLFPSHSRGQRGPGVRSIFLLSHERSRTLLPYDRREGGEEFFLFIIL